VEQPTESWEDEIINKVKRFGYFLFGAGVALLGEHIVSYGVSFDMILQNHGLYGLIMIVIAFILLAKMTPNIEVPNNA